ncbi:MAG: SRPBCC family protein [Acidobacteriota bacterium]
MQFTYNLQINAPIQKVFALVDDEQNLKLWMDGLEETIYPESLNRQNPVGTKFKQRIREGRRIAEYDGEVLVYENPTHLAIIIGNQQFTMQVDYRFSAKGEWTWLDYSATMVGGNFFMKLFAKLFAPLTRRILDRQMRKLKEVAENSSPYQMHSNAFAAAK